jgi:hypothetical protein
MRMARGCCSYLIRMRGIVGVRNLNMEERRTGIQPGVKCRRKLHGVA